MIVVETICHFSRHLPGPVSMRWFPYRLMMSSSSLTWSGSTLTASVQVFETNLLLLASRILGQKTNITNRNWLASSSYKSRTVTVLRKPASLGFCSSEQKPNLLIRLTRFLCETMSECIETTSSTVGRVNGLMQVID